MSDIRVKKLSAAAAATVAATHNVSDAAEQSIVARESAKVAGLLQRLAATDTEIARDAKQELWNAVRRAGRPNAQDDRRAIVGQLEASLNQGQPAIIYREALWMLSEIGDGNSVKSIAALLSNTTTREDARMALERIPGDESLEALRSALVAAPEDFKINIAQSLRARGEHVPGLPCVKLDPADTKAT